jgi:hypothetical protein
MGADSKLGRVGPGADSSHVCKCGRTRVGRKCKLMGAGGWDRAQTQCSRTEERQFACSHCNGDTSLGADGCDIGRGPERERAAGGAGARGYQRGARGYRGGGYKLTLPLLYFCQSLF